MKDLSKLELVQINGGCDCQPVGNNPYVNAGYHAGYHIGRAIGQTIKDIKAIFS